MDQDIEHLAPKPEIVTSTDVETIFRPSIQRLVRFKSRLDDQPVSEEISPSWQQDLGFTDIESAVRSYYLRDDKTPPLKIPDEDVEEKIRSIPQTVNQAISRRTGHEANYWKLIGVKEDILLNELAYRYYLAREVLAPLISLWMYKTLAEFSQIPNPKRMAFLYRDGYLPEVFARFLVQARLPGINANEEDLVAVDLNRINVYEDPGNVLNKRYNPNLRPYLRDKIGEDDGKTVFVIDTGTSGTMIPPVADNYLNSSVHARYYELANDFKLPSKTATPFKDPSVKIGFGEIEHTLIPKAANGEYRERSVDFDETDGHWEPIIRTKSDPVESAYLIASEMGYRDYLQEVEEGKRPFPAVDTDPSALQKMAQLLLGDPDSQFGYSIIQNLGVQIPHDLKPDTDDTQELMRLKNAMRAQKQEQNLKTNTKIILNPSKINYPN